MEREKREKRKREWEFWIHFNVFCAINGKYKEISWGLEKEEEEKKVTSRSTEKTRA